MKIKHGLSKHPIYRSWVGMRSRCNNPKNKKYYRYGARGIKVCERWENFALFLEDMGSKPGKEYSINRINNDGDYSPENCEWANPIQQAQNRGKRHYYGRIKKENCINGHNLNKSKLYKGKRLCIECRNVRSKNHWRKKNWSKKRYNQVIKLEKLTRGDK